MAPPKTARSGQDDSRPDASTPKEKNGSGATTQSNGKMRRVASSAGSNLREVTNANATKNAAAPTATTTTGSVPEPASPGLQWPAFDRDVLHAYRRAYRLKTPSSFVSDHHQWVLTQPGSIGLYSPTIARRKEYRRQTKDQLTSAVRRHFNGLGAQENDIIVDFLHKIRCQSASKWRTRRPEHVSQDLER
ncbi:hypothetical protein N656DRAFT_798468 [Canariomyces notabilis]|uniref:Histone deacetylase complex subunit SAP30 Sin3 binding domain-containing protein n=1 Tax=Canariomyces notabilis TaxID=2074819 RepID=A0AAN6YSP7_9PEZI|nr:hypothetical protein N656DRAFT_798468 [Canariomyces arenarius]